MHKISKATVMFLECPICLGTDFYTGKFSILNDYGIQCASCGLSMEISITDNKMTKEEHDAACFKAGHEAWNQCARKVEQK